MASSQTASVIPIKPEELFSQLDRATAFIRSVTWTPQKLPLSETRQEKSVSTTLRWAESSNPRLEERNLSLIGVAKSLSGSTELIDEDINHVLFCVQKGLQLAIHFMTVYYRMSGLSQLIEQNRRPGMPQGQVAEMKEKTATASAIALYVLSYYVVWDLSQYKQNEVEGNRMEFGGIPEFTFENPTRSLSCAMFYYTAYIAESGAVKTGLDFVKLSLLYFKAIVAEVRLREEGFKHTSTFVDNIYQLVGSEFCIKGFTAELNGGEVSIEFNRVELGDIVGNREGKHKAFRTVQRLLAYDLRAKRNPFLDLGGFAQIELGHGSPGTGKTLMASLTATLLSDYAKVLGIPVLIRTYPGNVISTFQGGSAERALAWWLPFEDLGRVHYGIIDDCEGNFKDRTLQGVSGGVVENISIFLTRSEGAAAKPHGHWVLHLLTNIADIIDPAVLSRCIGKFMIDGAVTFEDFVDQDYLWWRRLEEINPGFVDMIDPEGYHYLDAQKVVSSLSAISTGLDRPKNDRLREVFDRVSRMYDPKQQAFFAEFFRQVKEVFPKFTSRDVRNIQRAVDGRITDFDLPDEWMENPEIFFGPTVQYETKKSMLIELTRENMKGLSFAEIRLQEVIRYLESLVVIQDAGRERQIVELIERAQLTKSANERLQKIEKS